MELKQDIVIQGDENYYFHDDDHFIESVPHRITDSYSKDRLNYRFAHLEIYNEVNSFGEPHHYPKGMQLRVTRVERNPAFFGYDIYFETLTPGIFHPLRLFTIEGRRSGKFDIKIPQFEKLIESEFRILPYR